MRILLLGQNGQLGWEAKRTLACLGDVYSYDYPEVDFTRPQQLANLVKQHCPQVIFNAVAYTAVDRAEQEHETARLVNAVAPGELAEAALKCGALLLHFSTDYVFDGMKNAPYLESDSTNPLNVYGQTKLDGEKAITAVGGSWLTF
ncbi:MAG: NAD(P)-dependent oxidoreductase, partial [Anaerolineae bacterium]|nr:NAD(P)-dependent oxidoreductase [Anaerolineae bacterium]